MHASLPLAAFTALAGLASAAAAQTTVRISTSSAGLQSDAGYQNGSRHPVITPDGRYVAFRSSASNLVAGDTNGVADIFVHDRQTGATFLVSDAASGPGGGQANSEALDPWLSRDGRFVVFTSWATNLTLDPDGNTVPDVFVRDRQSGTTQLVSRTPSGATGDDPSMQPTLTPDGRWIAFASLADDLVPGDLNDLFDIYLFDGQTGVLEQLTFDFNGGPLNYHCNHPSLSADGRFMAFESIASDVVSGDTNNVSDIFVLDRQTGVATRVNVAPGGVQGDGSSFHATLSADGSRVLFESWANSYGLGDEYFYMDVFLCDRPSGALSLVSKSTAGVAGLGNSDWGVITQDGLWAVFKSDAGNLVAGDDNGSLDMFLSDLTTGAVERVSVGDAGQQGSGLLFRASASDGGRWVAFDSAADVLVPADTNAALDIFVRDRALAVPPMATYCTAKVNSLGCTPRIGVGGSPLLSGFDAFFVTAGVVRNQKSGILFWGVAPAALPFGGGTLCVQTPIVRTPVQNSGGTPGGSDCSGAYSFHFDQAYMASESLAAGAQVYAQYWSRDPGFAPPENVGLTDALHFTVVP